MKRILSCLFCFISFFHVFAQLEVSVHVKDDRDNPLDGVWVSIEGQGSPKPTQFGGNLILKLQGLKYKPGSSVKFVLSKAGYHVDVPHMLQQNLPNENNTQAIAFVMKKDDVENSILIKGIVKNNKGDLLEGVEITIKQTEVSTKTNKDGVFNIMAPRSLINSNIDIRFEAPRYQFEVLEYHVIPSVKLVEVIGKLIQTNAGNDTKDKLFDFGPSEVNSSLKNIFNSVGNSYDWFQGTKNLKLTYQDQRKYLKMKNLEVIREFNSKNTSTGHFGYGWSHSFNQYIDLKHSTICDIIFYDHKGRKIKFTPMVDCSKILLLLQTKLVDKIEQLSLEELLSLERATSSNILLPLNQVAYIGAGDNDAIQLKVLPLGFQITYGKNTHYLFNREGVIVSIEEWKKPPVKILYGRKSQINAIESNDRYIEFTYNENNLIEKAVYEDTTTWQYAYDDKARLIGVKQNGRKTYAYKYDTENRLIEYTTYKAGKEKDDIKKVLYSHEGWLNKIIGRDKSVEWIFSDSINISKAIQVHSDTGFENQNVDWWADTVSYSFNNQTKELSMKKKGRTKHFKITPCGCLPLEIVKNNDTIRYTYNHLGNLIKIENKNSLTDITYSSTLGKMSHILTLSKETRDTTLNLNFNYDDEGNLIFTKDNNGNSVALDYKNYKISRLTTTIQSDSGQVAKNEIKLEYNLNGKPIKLITDIGTLMVDWSKEGEVISVYSNDDKSKVSRLVSEAIKTVTGMTSPAITKLDTEYKDLENDSIDVASK